MLTNLRDAFGGQSRSPNIVPFHMLGIIIIISIRTKGTNTEKQLTQQYRL